jgi:hypothetical protein
MKQNVIVSKKILSKAQTLRSCKVFINRQYTHIIFIYKLYLVDIELKNILQKFVICIFSSIFVLQFRITPEYF